MAIGTRPYMLSYQQTLLNRTHWSFNSKRGTLIPSVCWNIFTSYTDGYNFSFFHWCKKNICKPSIESNVQIIIAMGLVSQQRISASERATHKQKGGPAYSSPLAYPHLLLNSQTFLPAATMPIVHDDWLLHTFSSHLFSCSAAWRTWTAPTSQWLEKANCCQHHMTSGHLTRHPYGFLRLRSFF